MQKENWNDAIKDITLPDEEVRQAALARWNQLAKPLHGMGKLEETIARIAAIQGTIHPLIDKKGIVVLCADNGIVKEGVSQTGDEVTAVVAGNFLSGQTSVCKMAKAAGADVLPYDIGIRTDVKGLTRTPYKISCGTNNFLREPAMTRKETIQAIHIGMQIVKERKQEGYEILATGEMGIGNTTTSSAVACSLTGEPVEVMTGRGAGLSDKGLTRKKAVIREGLDKWRPDPSDVVDVLSKVGGLDLAIRSRQYWTALLLRWRLLRRRGFIRQYGTIYLLLTAPRNPLTQGFLRSLAWKRRCVLRWPLGKERAPARSFRFLIWRWPSMRR